MGKGRLEAFSDGVVAIVLTIMVLELKVPPGADLAALRPLLPTFLAYVLSFVNVGIYWNNHHHMLHVTTRVTGRILWANLHLLFWLSLIPFTTGWVGDHPAAAVPTAIYGGVLLAAALAYTVLQRAIIRDQGPRSRLAALLGSDRKGKVSLLLYAAGIALAFVEPGVSDGIYVTVALMWLVPDRRIEGHLGEGGSGSGPAGGRGVAAD